MPILCDKELTSGPRTGQVCGQRATNCPHRVWICQRCSSEFGSSRIRYQRHLSKCNKTEDDAVGKASSGATAEKPLTTTDLETRLLKKLDAAIQKRMETFKEEYISRTTQVSATVEAPTYHIDLTDYCSIGADMYDILVQKIGPDSAVDYIYESVEKRCPLNIFKKTYLDDREYRTYPLATKGNDMRYVDCRRVLVSDIDGQLLAQMVQEGIQNALLKTGGALIKTKFGYSEECPDSNRSLDMMRTIQDAAYDIKRRLPRTDIIKTLKDWTCSEELHPFYINHACDKATVYRVEHGVVPQLHFT